MHDIRLAIGLIGFLSVAAFFLVVRLLRDRSPHLQTSLALGIVITIFLYVEYVWDQLWIVKWIPLPSVIVLSNWFPIFLAGLGACVWLRFGQGRGRGLVVVGIILIAAIGSLFYFVAGGPPNCKSEWDYPRHTDEYVLHLQTTPHTCSAAAAATLLGTVGVPATEGEMAELCLTRSGSSFFGLPISPAGTTWLGLYHGMASKLHGSGYRVVLFEGSTSQIEELAKMHPVLLCCQLEPEMAELLPQYVSEDGWIPGTSHSVVYLGRFRDGHHVGDPSRGWERWSDQDLELLWTGQGLRMLQVNPKRNSTD